jgi:hypothetical protein
MVASSNTVDEAMVGGQVHAHEGAESNGDLRRSMRLGVPHRMRTPRRVATALAAVLAAVSSSMAIAGAVAPAGTWRVTASPNARGAAINVLAAVSCAPRTASCVAVGSSARTLSTPSVPLAERWDGSRWAIQATPTPRGTSDTLYGIDCVTTTTCVAVGDDFQLASHHTIPLVETWDGTRWRVAAPASVGSFSTLRAVACTSSSACTAVGYLHGAGGVTEALVERWDGRVWRVQASATPLAGVQLLGVACVTVASCTAVGDRNQGAGDARPFAETWSGTSWRERTVPLPAGAPGGLLDAVDCWSPSSCMTTGTDFATGGPSLAERWNGASWRPTPTPDPANYQLSFAEDELDGVACTSSSSCVASGEYAPHGVGDYYLESWNGSHWVLRSVPRPGGYEHGTLLAVACAVHQCIAVGGYAGTTLIQRTLAVAG